MPASAGAQEYGLVTQWGERGTGESQFRGAQGIATDTAGRVYVVDSGNGRIQKFRPAGTFLTQWSTDAAPFGVATDDDGFVYVTHPGGNSIQRYSSTGNPAGSQVLANQSPWDVAADHLGNIWMIDRGVASPNVTRYSATGPSGTFTCKLFPPGGGSWQPQGLAVDASNVLYVSDSENHLVHTIDSAGCSFTGSWNARGSSEGGVATDAAGDVYVLDKGSCSPSNPDCGSGPRVRKFSPSGSLITTWGEGELTFPIDVDADAAGNVYVTGDNQVKKYAAGAGGGGEAGAPPAPVAGKTVNVEPTEGKVRTRCKGERKFTRLRSADQIPVGCVVDTRRGRIELTSATNSRGKTQSALFYAGLFKVKQGKGKRAQTVLALTGSLKCRSARASAARKRGRRGRGRRLWGNGKGRFRTKGRRGAATVRGTKWLVQDRCDGSTLFKVKRGVVKVRDFRRKKTIKLRAGQRYVAKPRRR